MQKMTDKNTLQADLQFDFTAKKYYVIFRVLKQKEKEITK